LNMSGFDGAKLGEEVLQLGIISTVGQIFDEEVVFLGSNGSNCVLRLLFVLFVVLGYLKLLALQLVVIDGI
jgi:hypothetical protein